MRIYMSICTCMEARSNPVCHPQTLSTLGLQQGVSLTWNSLTRLVWLTHQAPGISRTWTRGSATAPDFYKCGFWRLSSGSCGYSADIVLTGLSSSLAIKQLFIYLSIYLLIYCTDPSFCLITLLPGKTLLFLVMQINFVSKKYCLFAKFYLTALEKCSRFITSETFNLYSYVDICVVPWVFKTLVSCQWLMSASQVLSLYTFLRLGFLSEYVRLFDSNSSCIRQSYFVCFVLLLFLETPAWVYVFAHHPCVYWVSPLLCNISRWAPQRWFRFLLPLFTRHFHLTLSYISIWFCMFFTLGPLTYLSPSECFTW